MRTLLLAATLLVSNPSPLPGLVYHGSTTSRQVALTFDAGADRGYASRILDTLEQRHVHASFGMTGRWAEANPDLLKRMAADGDAFLNHTYDHRSFSGLSTRTLPLTTSQRTWEITTTERIVFKLTHRSTRPFFRPPYGDLDRAVVPLAGRLGYRFVVMWTVDSLGWAHLPAPSILRRCLTMARPGGIILMHVGIQSQDAFALPELIRALQTRGYRIVTVPQLFGER